MYYSFFLCWSISSDKYILNRLYKFRSFATVIFCKIFWIMLYFNTLRYCESLKNCLPENSNYFNFFQHCCNFRNKPMLNSIHQILKLCYSNILQNMSRNVSLRDKFNEFCQVLINIQGSVFRSRILKTVAK